MLNKIVLFFKTKWIFDSIKNTNFLIIGHDNSNLIIKILSLASVEVVSFKILNLNIIFKLLLSGKKINKLNYFIKSIQLINPKIVLTTIDNDIDFYRLKNFFPNKKFVSIQNGYRTENKKAFLIKKGEKLQCDLIFCWGKQNIKYYKSIIKAKIVPIGSLKNNLLPLKKIKKKKIITYISEFRPIDENSKINFFNQGEIFWRDTLISDKKLVKQIYFYCKKNDLKFYILGRYNDYRKFKEIDFYDKIIGKKNFIYIPKKNYLSSYHSLIKSEIIFSMSSSIGYEIFSRDNKVIFFSKKINNLKNASKYFNFGWPFLKSKRGFFYSDKITNQEILRLTRNIIRSDKKKWINKTKKIRNQLIVYDFNNKIFKDMIKKI